MSHYYVRWVVLALVGVLSVQKGAGQNFSHKDKQAWLKADNLLSDGDYLGAKKIYESLYHVDSANQELNYKIGLCNFEIKPFRKSSRRYFEKVSVTDNPEADYYLGRLNHLDRQYDKALACFNRYKSRSGDKEHTNAEVSTLIGKCYTAMVLEAKADKTMQIENLGPVINTPYAEYAPLIPASEDFMLFTSRRKNNVHPALDPLGEYFEDIYISRKEKGEWQAPVMLDTTINTPLHDAGVGLSADGQKMLIYRTSKDLTGGDIYQSNCDNGVWSRPEILGKTVNSGFLETSACYSSDGETIFFSSNRPGGYGGKDLYMVRKLPNGNWGVPYNLGPNVNTEYDEDAPFIHPSGNILFFSSQGHTNMGGYDIFKSTFDETGKFGPAENLGYPLNTADDDIFFVLGTDASTGYFSSDREGGFGSQDIYRVIFSEDCLPLNVFTIHVLDESNNIVNKVEMTITDLNSRKVIGIYKSNSQNGKITLIVPPDKEYQVAIKATGFENYLSTAIFGPDSNVSFRLTTKNP